MWFNLLRECWVLHEYDDAAVKHDHSYLWGMNGASGWKWEKEVKASDRGKIKQMKG